jgi:hypothetical protein
MQAVPGPQSGHQMGILEQGDVEEDSAATDYENFFYHLRK